MAPSKLVLLLFAFIIHIAKCQFESWMKDWSGTNAQASGVNIADSTLFDLVLPGANRAGMNFDDSTTSITVSPSNEDDYKNVINALSTDQEKLAWSERQQGSILAQLLSGVRFLDLQFQCVDESGTKNFYSYNGILGANVAQVCNMVLCVRIISMQISKITITTHFYIIDYQ